jgi:hypothetical protein
MPPACPRYAAHSLAPLPLREFGGEERTTVGCRSALHPPPATHAKHCRGIGTGPLTPSVPGLRDSLPPAAERPRAAAATSRKPENPPRRQRWPPPALIDAGTRGCTSPAVAEHHLVVPSERERRDDWRLGGGSPAPCARQTVPTTATGEDAPVRVTDAVQCRVDQDWCRCPSMPWLKSPGTENPGPVRPRGISTDLDYARIRQPVKIFAMANTKLL